MRRANEAALAQALASRYARDTVQLSLAGLVTNNYLALRAYDAQLAVTVDIIKSREGSLDIVRNRVNAGLASPLDLHQSEGSLAAAKAQLASLRQQRALVEHQLALLAGQPGLTVPPVSYTHLDVYKRQVSVWSMIIAGVALLAVFVWQQSRTTSEPLIPLELFRDRNFSVSNLAIVTVGFAVTAMSLPMMDRVE